MTTVTSEVVVRLHVHVRPRTKPRASTCLGSLAKTDATDFRTGGRWIDGTVCTQVRKTHRVGDVGLRLSERDEFRNFSALAPGGSRLMPSRGHCRQLSLPRNVQLDGCKSTQRSRRTRIQSRSPKPPQPRHRAASGRSRHSSSYGYRKVNALSAGSYLVV